MKSEEQKQMIKKRILATVKLFFENKGQISDIDLARILTIAGYKTSSSTVGRDLTSNSTKILIGEENYNLISIMRKQNKIEGNIKGGKISASNNDITKNEIGQFTGCKVRRM